VKPLDQEPLLAARIMVEDCLNLMLDVDDIDR
jgi:DNA topoisomerase 2-associated protein PAT1